jgi:hypothetical protein
LDLGDFTDISTEQIFALSGTVFNEGNTTSSPGFVNVMLSSDNTITSADEIIDTIELSFLGAGASSSVRSIVQAPSEPGNYWLGLCVNPVEGETLTANNCSTASVSSSAASIQSAGNRPKPEENPVDNGTVLMVSSGNICSSAGLSCGGSVSGTLAANDCDIGPRGVGFPTDPITFTGKQGDTVSLSAQWTGVDGYLYLENPLGEIAAENDDSGNIAASRAEVVLQHSGSYTVWPTAFGEGDGGSYQLNLDCNNPQAPDLTVDAPQLGSSTLRSGQSLNISTEVRNSGGFTADAGKVNFVLAANPDLSAADRILQSNDVPALAGGASSTEAARVAIHATPGSYYVGACASLDSRETNTGNNCEVSGPITIEASDDFIAINSGLNDAWYNPATNGQGFFINIFPDENQVFLSWFTFDTTRPDASVDFELGDPGQRWLTAQGSYDLGVAELEVFLTRDGVFDSAQPPATTGSNPVGTMTLSFYDCNSGVIVFDLPSVNQSGSIEITRLSGENVAACESRLGGLPGSAAVTKNDGIDGLESRRPTSGIEAAETGGPGFNYNASLNDAWFDPATNGQGFFFNIFPDSNFVFLSWFTYDLSRPEAGTPSTLGEPGHRWLTAQGPFDGDTANLKLYSTSGGVFNSGSLPQSNTVEVGSITASFEDCDAGLISYDIASVGRENDIPIQRLAPDSIPACEAESGRRAAAAVSAGDTPLGATAGVIPSGKTTLANLCEGSVDWAFDWPDVEGASFYQFELYRNDSLLDSPRVRASSASSEFSYAGKENVIEEEHLDSWHWRYRPVMGFGEKTAAAWSQDFYFSIQSPDNPCVN